MLVRLDQGQDVVLADVPAFQLGSLMVVPSLLQVDAGDGGRTLEPRVMQVLVLLARHEGEVVSRDALLEYCWDGRFVGDNAIHRVMSRLRALGNDSSAFTLETIPRVGYRLKSSLVTLPASRPAYADAVPPPAMPPPAPAALAGGSRRAVVSGLIAAGAGAAAWRWWPAAASQPAMADKLVEKAREALLDGLPAQTEQAIAYLDQAVAIAPGHEGAWGALAMALNSQLEHVPAAGLPLIASRSADAAKRALAIAPGNIEAHVAAVTIQPNFGHWQANEQALLALEARFGRHPAIDGALGWLLCDVGRWREAVVRFRGALAGEPFHPHNRLVLALGLWGQGALAEADQLLAESARLWPRHPHIWFNHFTFLVSNGRAADALAKVRDEAGRPAQAPGEEALPYVALDRFAAAMLTRRSDDIARASAAFDQPLQALPMARYIGFLVALQRMDDAFTWLDRTYFGGPGWPVPAPLSRRKTSVLFYTDPLRRDPRYARLLQRTGIAQYWRATGTRPDKPI